jgi:hypothetical protein
LDEGGLLLPPPLLLLLLRRAAAALVEDDMIYNKSAQTMPTTTTTIRRTVFYEREGFKLKVEPRQISESRPTASIFQFSIASEQIHERSLQAPPCKLHTSSHAADHSSR